MKKAQDEKHQVRVSRDSTVLTLDEDFFVVKKGPR